MKRTINENENYLQKALEGNDMADIAAKTGATRMQEDKSIIFSEANAIITAKQKDPWTSNHPHFNRSDPNYQLTRREQVITLRLRTGYIRLKE
ncbi:hypothetical protein ElyMa_005419000 [Elysia marginata]|uniref:Uncharacterized protein n=1 Tax=Elysia marginata TaxID=1093978 RepID=A0AAV4EIY6_9GAST|nr:hypothetical protein ElyMa_005419000 [Elysia marginata]